MKKTLLDIFIAFALVAFVTSCDTTVQVTGNFTLENDKKIVVYLQELSYDKTVGKIVATDTEGQPLEVKSDKLPVELETSFDSQSGFCFDFEIPKPALFALYLRVGEGNELSGYNTTFYLEPGGKISLEFVPSGKYGVKCRHSSISDANNKALVTFGEITNSILTNKFNNPPSDIEGEKVFLGSFSATADSILSESRLKSIVRKFINIKALDTYYSALIRSSLNEISDFNIEYFDDDFIFFFPSGIQNLVGVLNIKADLDPYIRRKNLSIISSQIEMLEASISNQRVIDKTISYILNSYITSYRDYDNFEKNRDDFAAIADRISDLQISLQLKESFEKLGYTVVGSLAPPIKLEDRNGNMISFESFKGKTVVVDIWATWCVPCLRQMPRIKELEHEFEGKEIVFIGICMGSKKEDWLQKLEEFELDNIQLFDAGDDFAKALNISAVPHILIYNQESKLEIYQTNINQLSMQLK